MSQLPLIGLTKADEAERIRSSLIEIAGRDLCEEIQSVYLADERPWIVGYSGGKDSTSALQLIWMALDVGWTRTSDESPVYVISSDTLVETPVIVDYIDSHALTNQPCCSGAGTSDRSFTKVSPTVEEGFWVNLIGRGYPAPSTRFRWCTERLKIKPANRFIQERVGEFGEVVVVLGVRRGESATRDQVMSLHRIPGERLSRHSTLPNAFVFTARRGIHCQRRLDLLVAGRFALGKRQPRAARPLPECAGRRVPSRRRQHHSLRAGIAASAAGCALS